VVLPVETDEEHPYGRPGVVSPFNEKLDTFVRLAFLAAVTSRIRVASGVILPPLRNVFATARQIMTVDQLSGGRLDLGVGVGWHQREIELMGGDFHTRGAYTDEFIDALTRLFTQREPSFEGRHIAFPKVGFEPKPVQTPRPPILVGGDTLPAMRRAAKRGDGWYGHAASVEQGRERIDQVRGLLKENGRDAAGFEMVLQVWDPPPREALEGYFAAGAHRLVCAPFTFQDTDTVGKIEAYAESIGLQPTG